MSCVVVLPVNTLLACANKKVTALAKRAFLLKRRFSFPRDLVYFSSPPKGTPLIASSMYYVLL